MSAVLLALGVSALVAGRVTQRRARAHRLTGRRRLAGAERSARATLCAGVALLGASVIGLLFGG